MRCSENANENCRGRRNIPANYSSARNARDIAYNHKCFKMEIKRRLQALCKATPRAVEYIIEQCQHLFLITSPTLGDPIQSLLFFYSLSLSLFCLLSWTY